MVRAEHGPSWGEIEVGRSLTRLSTPILLQKTGGAGMHRKTLIVLLAAAGLLPAINTLRAQQANSSGEGPSPAQLPSEIVFKVRDDRSTVTLTEQASKIVEHSARIKSVDGHDPKIVDIQAISPTQIRVHGLSSGVTDVVLTDEHDKRYRVEVFVIGDVRHLERLIKHMFPHSSIRVIGIRGSVILDGWMTQPEDINKVVAIAETFSENVLNHMRVGGVQQVMLKCQILEVQRSKMRRLGINFLVNGQDRYLVQSAGGLTPVTSLSTGALNGPAAIGLTGFSESTLSFGVFNSNKVFQMFVQALRDEGMLQLQSEPTLVTTNGAPANILSGGEVPIVVPAGLGTVGIEFRSFGIQLDAVPILLGNGRVRLKIRPEVSERDFSSAVTVQGIAVPGFTVRRVETQVEMQLGETLAIGGLITRRETETATKVPLFGELPWIGTMFSRKTSDVSETELIVLVTPQYTSAMKPGQVPAGGPGQFTDTPTDKELFFHQMIEVPKYGGDCDHCNGSGFVTPAGGTSRNCDACSAGRGLGLGLGLRGGHGSGCGSCTGCRSGMGCTDGGTGAVAAPSAVAAPPAVVTPAVQPATQPRSAADMAPVPPSAALPGLIEPETR